MVARLASMPVIEQAKGIIMAQCGWSADQAVEAMRQVSQRTNVKMRVLATQIIATTVGTTALPAAAGPDRIASVLPFPEAGHFPPEPAAAVAEQQAE